MSKDWQWPGNAEAAVSFSYDDGVDSHLDQAMPDLENAGFRGTFYPTLGYDVVPLRKAEWKNAFLRGHEIGNHTIHHPCDDPRGSHNLRKYSPVDIRTEVLAGAAWLNEHIGVDPDRTFGYPCGDIAIGDPPDENSYDAAVRTCHFAARTTRRGINDPLEVPKNLLRIKGKAFATQHATEIIEYVEEGAQLRGWAVLLFHGIGDKWIATARQAHQQLIEHLLDGRFWVAPIKVVTRYILDSQ